MFSLDELKNIVKTYIYDSDTKELKLRSKIDTSSKRPEDLTPNERNKIISAYFILQTIRAMERGLLGSKGKENQESLDEIQTDFYMEALKPGKRILNFSNALTNKATDEIFGQLVSPREAERYQAEIYLQYVLSESGKKATNIQRGLDGGISPTISYDIEDLEKKNNFKKQLDPNNPMYTQPQKKIDLTPEQLTHRKEIVEKLITDYKKMEHDEWYNSRKEKEDTDMQRVANLVRSNGIINSINGQDVLFRSLIAAQNLSIEGEQDFFEEMLKQPAVSDALIELKKAGQTHTIHTEAQENERDGKINSDGILNGHFITNGERMHKEVNEYISEHPNAVTFAKKALRGRSLFTVGYGDSELMKKSKVIELVARTQGKLTSRTRNNDGNIVLQVDDGKEQIK